MSDRLVSISFLRKEIEEYMEKSKPELDYEAYFGMAILYEFINKKLRELNE